MLTAIPKRVLIRREVTIKDRDCERVATKQGKVHFSVARWRLTEFSESSGPDTESASILHVFYESKDERKVMNCFSAAGIDLGAVEAVPVDPNSSHAHEQRIMYMKESLFLEDECAYEEGPPREVAQR